MKQLSLILPIVRRAFDLNGTQSMLIRCRVLTLTYATRLELLTTISRYSISLVVAATLASTGFAARFVPLGDLAGEELFSTALDISADGRVVVGTARNGQSEREAFWWTADEGMQGLGDLPNGAFYSIAEAVSADGRVVIGRGTSDDSSVDDGFRWTFETGMEPLGSLSPNSTVREYSYGSGVSADGNIAVGGSGSGSGNEAFRWTNEDGMNGIGDLSGGSFGSLAYDISADGTVIVGSSKSDIALEAFRWTENGGMEGLGFLPGLERESHAWAVSADGKTIVGSSVRTGWYWTEGTGMVALPFLLDASKPVIIPADVSADGSVIVGSTVTVDDFRNPSPAFIWTAERGTESLQQYVIEEHGWDAEGWIINRAHAVSDDGKVIVGRGVNPQGRIEAWMLDLRIPEPSGLLLSTIGVCVPVLSRRWNRSIQKHNFAICRRVHRPPARTAVGNLRRRESPNARRTMKPSRK